MYREKYIKKQSYQRLWNEDKYRKELVISKTKKRASLRCQYIINKKKKMKVTKTYRHFRSIWDERREN